MSSSADRTVPSSQSEGLASALTAAGADVRSLVYGTTTHVDFAVGWEEGKGGRNAEKALLLATAAAEGEEGTALMAHAMDVVHICRAAGEALSLRAGKEEAGAAAMAAPPLRR